MTAKVLHGRRNDGQYWVNVKPRNAEKGNIGSGGIILKFDSKKDAKKYTKTFNKLENTRLGPTDNNNKGKVVLGTVGVIAGIGLLALGLKNTKIAQQATEFIKNSDAIQNGIKYAKESKVGVFISDAAQSGIKFIKEILQKPKVFTEGAGI